MGRPTQPAQDALFFQVLRAALIEMQVRRSSGKGSEEEGVMRANWRLRLTENNVIAKYAMTSDWPLDQEVNEWLQRLWDFLGMKCREVPTARRRVMAQKYPMRERDKSSSARRVAEIMHCLHLQPHPLDSCGAYLEYFAAALAGYPQPMPVGSQLLYAPDLHARMRAHGIELISA